MTTPTFNPISSLLNYVRYYTQFDPYYYTVDNRPLSDISSNSSTLSTGVDAARRAVLIETLNRNIRETGENSAASKFMSGLAPSYQATPAIRIGVGEVLVPLPISNSPSQVILKRGINQGNVDLTYTPTGTVGQSVIYTVEYQYVDITAGAPVGTYFFDNTNNSLFDTCLNGVLVFQIKQGTPATTGNETVPGTTANWFPLYNFRLTGGSSTWDRIWLHDSSPKLLKHNYLSESLALRVPVVSGGAYTTSYDPVPAWQLVQGSAYSLVATVDLSSKASSLNSYRDIKFDLSFATTNTGGANFAFQVSYATATNIGSPTALNSWSYTDNTAELIPNPGTANVLTTATLSGKVPGWVLNVANTPKILVLKFTRPIASDTSNGNMLITGIHAYQSW